MLHAYGDAISPHLYQYNTHTEPFCILSTVYNVIYTVWLYYAVHYCTVMMSCIDLAHTVYTYFCILYTKNMCVFRYRDVYNSDWTGFAAAVGKEFFAASFDSTGAILLLVLRGLLPDGRFGIEIILVGGYWWFLFEPVNFQVEVPIFFLKLFAGHLQIRQKLRVGSCMTFFRHGCYSHICLAQWRMRVPYNFIHGLVPKDLASCWAICTHLMPVITMIISQRLRFTIGFGNPAPSELWKEGRKMIAQ